jgi:hypothetical protein
MDQRKKRAEKNPGSVHVGFVVDKVALGEVFFPESFGFTLSISFNPCSITLKNEKKLMFFFIFITGLHSKHSVCGASVTSAAEPFTTKKIANI